MNFINKNKIKNFSQGKLLNIFLILVLAVAINHVVFSYLLINRESAKASDIFGYAQVGTNNYQQNGFKYLDKLKLYSEIDQVNFALLNKVNNYIYFAIENQDNKSLLIKFDLENFDRQAELIIPDYQIKTGVIDNDKQKIYLGVEAENELLAIKKRIIKIDLKTFSIKDAIDLQPDDIISQPYFDKSNQFIYYWQSNGQGTKLLKINTAPDNFQREKLIKIGSRNNSLTYAHSLVLAPKPNKGFIYLANQNKIAVIDLANFGLAQFVETDEHLIYRLLGVDPELGYLYYSTKYAYKYTQLRRLDLNTLTFDSDILNLQSISNCQKMIVDWSEPIKHFAYIIMSKGVITEKDLEYKEEDELSVFHVSAMPATPLEIIKVNLTDFSRVAKIALNSDSLKLRSVMPDFNNDLLYLATDGNESYLNKINIDSTDIFEEKDVYNLPAGEKNISSGIVDPSLGYAYFSVQENINEPRKIIKIDLKTFERVDSLELAGNEKEIFTAFLDPLSHLGYFVTNQGIVIRINLLKFEKIDSLNIGLSNLVTSWVDLKNGLAYFGNSSGSLAQISILPDDFNYLGNINTSLNSHSALAIDTLNNYAYLADNDNKEGHIIKVDLLNFSEVAKIATGGWTNFKSVRIDQKNELAYFVTEQDRMVLVKIAPDNFRYLNSYDMPLVFRGSDQYIEDPSNKDLVYYLANSGNNSKIIKIKFKGTNRPEVLDYFNLPEQTGPMASMVLDDSYGHIYLGTADYNYIYKIAYTPLKGKIRAFKVNIPEDNFTVDYFEFYSHERLGNIKLALYDFDKNLIWQSSTIKNTANNDWLRVDVSQGARQYLQGLKAGDYWLAWQTDAVANIASYNQGGYGDGFEMNYKFGLFPKKISNEKLTDAVWSIYGVKQ
ncbi:MAG: hypothetical protein GF365_04775 [Candidatus Buchananbacteria bacterium]|nr:hypothetical protein [Candidatus Buchananbacteria bacterium]